MVVAPYTGLALVTASAGGSKFIEYQDKIEQSANLIKAWDENAAKLKEQGKYITDPSLISVIDKIEELTRALRKHIVRKY